jgi:hypothetical protein
MKSFKEPEADMGMIPAIGVTTGWMTGWAFAFWLSAQMQVSYVAAFGIIYGSLVAVATIATWEHMTYRKHISRIDTLMRRCGNRA